MRWLNAKGSLFDCIQADFTSIKIKTDLTIWFYFEDVNKTEGEHTMKEFDPFVSKYLLDQGLQKTTAKMLEQFQDKLPTEFLDF